MGGERRYVLHRARVTDGPRLDVLTPRGDRTAHVAVCAPPACSEASRRRVEPGKVDHAAILVEATVPGPDADALGEYELTSPTGQILDRLRGLKPLDDILDV